MIQACSRLPAAAPWVPGFLLLSPLHPGSRTSVSGSRDHTLQRCAVGTLHYREGVEQAQGATPATENTPATDTAAPITPEVERDAGLSTDRGASNAGQPRPAVEQPELTVDQLSESDLIARFAPLLRPPETTEPSPYELLGPGDDAAVVAAPDGRFVISTDTQVQGQDFLLEWPSAVRSTGYDTGHKCATQNLADSAAMGAVASCLVVSLTLPPCTPVTWVEDFARGLRDGVLACGAQQCRIVGGDLGAGGELSATATVTGDLQGRPPVRRSGARPGDRVVLAGTLGRAAAGLELLSSPRYVPGQSPELDALTADQLRPVSPVPLGVTLAEAGATAMIDVSDGLIRDMTRVAQASDVVVEFDPTALQEMTKPLVAAGKLLDRDPLHWVLHGGEDHGLLSTIPRDIQLPPGVIPLGSVLAAPPGCEGERALPPEINRSHAPPVDTAARSTGRSQFSDRIRIGATAVHELPAAVRGRGWDHFESQDGFECDGGAPVAGDGRT